MRLGHVGIPIGARPPSTRAHACAMGSWRSTIRMQGLGVFSKHRRWSSSPPPSAADRFSVFRAAVHVRQSSGALLAAGQGNDW